VNSSQFGHFVKESEDLLPEFVRSYEGSYRRLYQQLKRLSEDLQSVSSTINEIKECFDSIGSVHHLIT
jgi:uncharacterized protein YqiB (DUF1249 family)